MHELEDSPLMKVVELVKENQMKQKDIAAELGISQMRVSQLMKQAREGGLITTKAARGKRRKA